MKICYISKNFGDAATTLITKATQILDEYEKQAFDLTLRQLYYQFVRRNWFPLDWADPTTGSTNNERSYKRLGTIINDARLAGLIDWNRIIDRTRNLRGLSHWDSPEDIIKSVSQQFRIDLWKNQPNRVEVWIEKDALVGVIEDVCRKFDVPFFSCRGYTSQSEIWSASQRFVNYFNLNGQRTTILHFGDHDPSGVDMSRDITDRITLFCNHHLGREVVNIQRIALTIEQVRTYDPPPNPAKITDSRAKAYISEHGNSSWELDALEPAVISGLVEEKISELIEWDSWDADQSTINKGRKQLVECAKRWDVVVSKVLNKDP